jgi:predicted GIY-YIG superfamily endonuclease
MKFVYLLRSQMHPEQTYYGLADDVEARLKVHNAGGSKHTAKYKPWQLETYVAFSDADRALAFERYQKSGSGRAFAKKRL